MVKRNQTAEMADIGQQYQLRDEQAVRRYLSRHPSLIPLLHEAYPEIVHCFGSHEVSLELVEDPEIQDHRKVFALIRTGLDPETAVNQLHCFDARWWLLQSPRARGALNFDLEFA